MSNLRSGKDIFNLELFIPGSLIRCTNLYPLVYRSIVDAANVVKHWTPGYVRFCEEQCKERSSFLFHSNGEVLGGSGPGLAPGAADPIGPHVASSAALATSTASRLAAASRPGGLASSAHQSADTANNAAQAAMFYAMGEPTGLSIVPVEEAAAARLFADGLFAYGNKVTIEDTILDHLHRHSFLTSEDFLAGKTVSWIESGAIFQILGALYSKEGLPMMKVLAPSSENPEEMQIGWICLHSSMQLEFMM